MLRFSIKIFAFILPIVAAVIIISNCGDIVPFTGSISFDAKIYELHKRESHSIDNIAIGSSMTLNNLSSEVLVPFLKGESYYNVSSWGQTIAEDYDLLKILVPLFSPKQVFVVSHCGDFADGSLDCCSDIAKYLNNKKCSKILLETKYKFLRQFINFDSEYEGSKLDTCSYACLRFDAWGAVPLNVYGNDISEKRWNDQSHFTFDSDKKSYDSLRGLCDYLREKSVDLIFVFPPARKSYYDGCSVEMQKHINHIESIIQGCGHTFINEYDCNKYPDSLFSDACHLNAFGARQLTTNIVERLDSLCER